ncbi:unnamed protein product [Urochloa decumbens]|uniref:glutathione transferase n=1 Tax=Urochloa decumbens TaxID=240449 RepID=A0ABC9FJD1_9POAL
MAGGGGGGGYKLTLLAARRQVSPFVMRVRVALNLKGLRYDYVLEDLAAKSDLLLASNPVHKKVPVLLHAGKPVCESAVILHYLDDAFPATPRLLLPADDPYGRATHRLWAARVDATLHPAWMRVVRVKAEAAAAADERATAAATAAALLEQLEGLLGEEEERRFFGGDAIGYLDVVLGSYLTWIEALREVASVALLDAARTPRLAAWAERFAGSQAVMSVTPEVGWVVAYAEMLRARWDAEDGATAPRHQFK